MRRCLLLLLVALELLTGKEDSMASGTTDSNVALVPLQPRYQMRQRISVCFLRTRERDPNLLSLLAACRGHAAELKG